jgi:hypothetical protein
MEIHIQFNLNLNKTTTNNNSTVSIQTPAALLTTCLSKTIKWESL